MSIFRICKFCTHKRHGNYAVYHGACSGCFRYGLGDYCFCHRCQNFDGNWSKPDLFHRQPEEYCDMIDWIRKIGCTEYKKRKKQEIIFPTSCRVCSHKGWVGDRNSCHKCPHYSTGVTKSELQHLKRNQRNLDNEECYKCTHMDWVGSENFCHECRNYDPWFSKQISQKSRRKDTMHIRITKKKEKGHILLSDLQIGQLAMSLGGDERIYLRINSRLGPYGGSRVIQLSSPHYSHNVPSEDTIVRLLDKGEEVILRND